MPVRITATLASSMTNLVETAVSAGAAAGTLKVYTGAQPATPETAATGTLLATFTLTDPALAAAVSGVATLDADPDLTTTVLADGTAGWFRIADSNALAVLDGEVGTTGKALNFDAVAWTTGGTVNITTGTVTHPVTSA